jgi:hypothetical protein
VFGMRDQTLGQSADGDQTSNRCRDGWPGFLKRTRQFTQRNTPSEGVLHPAQTHSNLFLTLLSCWLAPLSVLCFGVSTPSHSVRSHRCDPANAGVSGPGPLGCVLSTWMMPGTAVQTAWQYDRSRSGTKWHCGALIKTFCSHVYVPAGSLVLGILLHGHTGIGASVRRRCGTQSYHCAACCRSACAGQTHGYRASLQSG